SSGAGNTGWANLRTPDSSTTARGPRPGAEKPVKDRVWVFRAPTAGRTTSPKTTETPVPRAAFDPAQRIAAARLRGPSGDGSSKGRWAPVRTIGGSVGRRNKER